MKKIFNPTQALVNKVSELTQSGRFSTIDSDALKAGISMEGVDLAVAEAFDVGVDTAAKSVVGVALESFGLDATKATMFTKAQKDAAGVIAAYARTPGAYVQASFENHVTAPASGRGEVFDPVNYAFSGFDYRNTPALGLEAFDEQNLNKYIGYSIVFNLQAATQDEACELYYPTITVTPDQGGFSITTKIQNILNQVRHSMSGNAVTWSQRNVLDCFIDPTILDSDILVCAPYYQNGAESSTANLVSSSLITPADVTVGETTFKTQPLLPGRTIDLLGISQHPGVAATGKLGYEDQLDGRVVLKNIYLRTNNLTAETGAKEVFKVEVLNTARSGFNKTVEGHGQELNLQYANDKLTFSAATKTIAGVAPTSTALIAAGNYNVFFRVKGTGEVNVEKGNISVNFPAIEIVKVTDNMGTTLDMADTAVAAAIAELGTIAVIGYDVDARRTNTNLRTKGLQAASYEWTERYHLRQGSPLMIPLPVMGGNSSNGGDLNDLITLARARNTNMGISALIQRAASLAVYQNVPASLNDPIPVQGIGRWHVKHYYGADNLVPTTMINSISSKDRIADLKAAFVARFRSDAYKMMVLTQYKTALDQMTGFSGARVCVGIVTDQTLGQYFMVDGESRLLGPDIDYVVKTTSDQRVRGKAYMTFVRPDVTEPSPLHFGLHAWRPEMTIEAQLQREGSIHKELIVQPANLHINILPVLHVYSVDMTDLARVVGEKNSINFHSV